MAKLLVNLDAMIARDDFAQIKRSIHKAIDDMG